MIRTYTCPVCGWTTDTTRAGAWILKDENGGFPRAVSIGVESVPLCLECGAKMVKEPTKKRSVTP